MILTYIQQGSGNPPNPPADGGDQYVGLDRFSRVVDQRWIKTSTGTALERIQYGFDAAGNRQWRKNLVQTTGQDEYYTYDNLYQLTVLKRGTLTGSPPISSVVWEEDFTLDPTGNWNNYVTTSLTQSRTHNKANEITQINGSSSLIAQNAAGNITKTPKPSDWTTAYDLTYDAWNRLVKVMDGASTVATYAYDGQNRRTTKTSGGSTRHYYYSNRWQVLEERVGASTSADRQFVWGLRYIDDLILRDRGSERFYALHDFFNCTAIVDTSGAVQERYGYDAFGGVRFMTAAFGSRSASLYDWETLFAAYRWDSESGLYQVRNRYLHPKLGRWLSRDPIGYLDDINLYAYLANRPVNAVDILGLQCGLTVHRAKFKVGLVWDWIPIDINAGHEWIEIDGQGYGFWPTGSALYSPGEVREGNDPYSGDRTGKNWDLECKTLHCIPGEGFVTTIREGTFGYSVLPAEIAEKFTFIQAGSGKGKSCANATCDDIKDCIKTVAAEWKSGRSYCLPKTNCRDLVQDVLRRCALNRASEDEK